MENILPEYLTLPEVVQMLRVHLSTLQNWDKDGTLRAVRIGKLKIRQWKQDDIIRFLEGK